MTETPLNEPLQHMCLLYGLFGGLMGSLCMGWLCSPAPAPQASLAVVNLQSLVEGQGLPPEESRAGMLAQLVKSLGADLDLFARQHNLVLLHKPTVAGGDIPDKTAAFLSWLGTRTQEGGHP